MKQLVSYQREVDKGELTTVASFGKADVLSLSPSSEVSACKIYDFIQEGKLDLKVFS